MIHALLLSLWIQAEGIMKKRKWPVLALALLLTGCLQGLTKPESAPSTALAKAAQLDDAQMQLVVASARSAKHICEANQAPANICAELPAAYEKWRAAQIAVRDALVAWQASGQASDETAYDVAVTQAIAVSGDLLALFNLLAAK